MSKTYRNLRSQETLDAIRARANAAKRKASFCAMLAYGSKGAGLEQALLDTGFDDLTLADLAELDFARREAEGR